MSTESIINIPQEAFAGLKPETEAPVETTAETQDVQEAPETVAEQPEVEGAEQPESFSVDDFINEQLGTLGVANEEGGEAEEKPKSEPELNAYTWAEKTGKSPEEFFKLQKDWEKENPDVVLKEHYKTKYSYLSEAEIDHLLQKEFGDDEFSDEPDMDKVIGKKKAVAEAVAYFNQQKQEMGIGVKKDAPAEIPQQYEEAYEFYQTQMQVAEQQKESRVQYLKDLSEYHKSFDGIEVTANVEVNGMKKDVSFKYSPNDTEKRKITEAQSDVSKLFAQFGEIQNGQMVIKNQKGLLDLLAKASVQQNYEKFLIEQGVAMGIESLVKNDLKRPNLEGRGSKPLSNTQTITVRSERGTR